MAIFSNDDELYAEILKDIEECVQAASETIASIVVENVGSVVYKPFDGKARIYERKGFDGGFIGSWKAIQQSERGKATGIVLSDPEEMELDPPSHGFGGEIPEFNKYSKDIFLDMMRRDEAMATAAAEGDRRPIMDEAIAEGTHWDFFVPKELQIEDDNWWTRPRDYWTPSIRRIMSEGTIEKNFRTILLSNNVKYNYTP